MQIKLRGKAKAFEQKAQQIRQFAGARPHHRFDASALAKQLKLIVVADANQLRQHLTLETQTAEQLFLNGSQDWSGGATADRPDGTRVVILNPTHSPQRQMATLMEEICHILLGHERSSITPHQQQLRDYHRRIEEEAYGVGAAVLLPCADLTARIEEGWSERRIAEFFGVSVSLVRFRRRFLELDAVVVR
jgi:Zn-dependent peptidase ImmA (M78 family)